MKPSEYIQKGWCKGNSAKDATGRGCDANGPFAVQWCLIGAVYAAYPYNSIAHEQIFERLCTKVGVPALWNDKEKRTQVEVVELLQSIGE